MIKVDIDKSNNHFCGLKVTGHANSDEYGKDLVCAAVSTLAQTLCNSVEEVGNVPEEQMGLEIKEGYLKFSLKEKCQSDEVDIMFKMFVVGVEGIEATYPEYVKLRIKEVQGHVKNF